MKKDCKKYNVIDGEPHLGSVIECTVTIERDDIIEAIAKAFCENDPAYVMFFVVDDEEINIYNFVTPDDINDLVRKMDEELLDDDYGSPKEIEFYRTFLEEKIESTASYEFVTVEYV